MRFAAFLFTFLFATSTLASCPVAEKMARDKGLKEALLSYYSCALAQNDDDTQLYLAQVFETGKGDISKNLQKSMLFYHLSAENGNATAMVRLSRLMTQLDANTETRSMLADFLAKIGTITTQNQNSSYSAQMLHPYALLVLAAEKPESKWFYTTRVKSDKQASQLLKDYTIDSALQKEALREATAWKQRKMNAVAYQVLTADEYNHFIDTLYPKNNVPDKYARAQAVNLLKERIESSKK